VGAIVGAASAAAVKQQILDRGFVLVGDIGDRYAGPISGLLSNPLDFNP
jgi:hypothetical protein